MWYGIPRDSVPHAMESRRIRSHMGQSPSGLHPTWERIPHPTWEGISRFHCRSIPHGTLGIRSRIGSNPWGGGAALWIPSPLGTESLGIPSHMESMHIPCEIVSRGIRSHIGSQGCDPKWDRIARDSISPGIGTRGNQSHMSHNPPTILVCQ